MPIYTTSKYRTVSNCSDLEEYYQCKKIINTVHVKNSFIQTTFWMCKDLLNLWGLELLFRTKLKWAARLARRLYIVTCLYVCVFIGNTSNIKKFNFWSCWASIETNKPTFMIVCCFRTTAALRVVASDWLLFDQSTASICLITWT